MNHGGDDVDDDDDDNDDDGDDDDDDNDDDEDDDDDYDDDEDDDDDDDGSSSLSSSPAPLLFPHSPIEYQLICSPRFLIFLAEMDRTCYSKNKFRQKARTTFLDCT